MYQPYLRECDERGDVCYLSEKNGRHRWVKLMFFIFMEEAWGGHVPGPWRTVQWPWWGSAPAGCRTAWSGECWWWGRPSVPPYTPSVPSTQREHVVKTTGEAIDNSNRGPWTTGGPDCSYRPWRDRSLQPNNMQPTMQHLSAGLKGKFRLGLCPNLQESMFTLLLSNQDSSLAPVAVAQHLTPAFCFWRNS